MRASRIHMAVALVASCLVGVAASSATPVHAGQNTIEILGPAGSGSFGNQVKVLSNGNYVVVDTGYDAGGKTDIGAVYLYDGHTNALISTLTGASTDDQIGLPGVYEVGNSNFVVSSPGWSNGATLHVGAATWVNGTTGLNGVVSAANSLIGPTVNGGISNGGVVALPNGNMVVVSPTMSFGGHTQVGAATFGSGNAPLVGTVGPTNSIMGSHDMDNVGRGARALPNGNYVISTPFWNGNRGESTFVNGTTGLPVGTVSAANSLVGSTADDNVGTATTVLTDGDYVVGSYQWQSGGLQVGAATFGSATAGVSGAVSAANSLVGSNDGDDVGERIVALSDGNYVVASSGWQNVADAVGAVTWSSGDSSNTKGLVTTMNSVYGGTLNDQVGSYGVFALSNGRYVVDSPNWDSGVANVGAVTVLPAGGSHGAVTNLNSIVGVSANDQIGLAGIAVLTNGNFVIASPHFKNGANANAGAVTFVVGSTNPHGNLPTASSLLGSHANDNVGNGGSGAFGLDGGVVALSNGNYVVNSPNWDNGATVDAGASTWGSGTVGVTGAISATNSVLGTTASEKVGDYAPVALTNGNYVFRTSAYGGGVSAVTFENGASAATGTVSAANSLVGLTAGDALGDQEITPLAGGGYFVVSRKFDNGAVTDASAVTLAEPTGVVGAPVDGINSSLGLVTQPPDPFLQHSTTVAALRTAGGAIVIGRRTENRVTLLYPPVAAAADNSPLPPARLVDTRPGFTTVDGQQAGTGLLAAGDTLTVHVAGRGGVAANAIAANLNVTATQPQLGGFLTVYPCGDPQPLASSVNYAADETVPNAVVAKIGAGGNVCVYTSQATHVIVDVNGAFPLSSSYHPLNPARLLETRPGLTTSDGQQQGGGLTAAAGIVELQVTGRAGVPADATAAVLNVTVTDPPAAAGYVTAYPCGGVVPTASNINFVPGQTIANGVIVQIGVGGKVCLYTSQPTQLIADIDGYFPAITAYRPLLPARLLETRPGYSTIDGQSQGADARPPLTVTTLHVAGRGGVPNDATAIVLNVTVTDPQAPGYVTVYPCGIDPPLASNLNVEAGETIANEVVVQVGSGGNVCLYNSQTTQLIADVEGYFGS